MTRKLLRGALPAAAALIVLALPAGSLYYEYNAGSASTIKAAAAGNAPRNSLRVIVRAPSACASYAAPLPGFHDALRRVVRDRHDGQRRVEAAIGHVYAAIDHVQIVVIVHAAVFVHHRNPRVVAHAARARLVLASAGSL